MSCWYHVMQRYLVCALVTYFSGCRCWCRYLSCMLMHWQVVDLLHLFDIVGDHQVMFMVLGACVDGIWLVWSAAGYFRAYHWWFEGYASVGIVLEWFDGLSVSEIDGWDSHQLSLTCDDVGDVAVVCWSVAKVIVASSGLTGDDQSLEEVLEDSRLRKFIFDLPLPRSLGWWAMGATKSFSCWMAVLWERLQSNSRMLVCAIEGKHEIYFAFLTHIRCLFVFPACLIWDSSCKGQKKVIVLLEDG